MLDRGEKLDDLVAKSDELGIQSKAFYKTVSISLQDCKIMLKPKLYLILYKLRLYTIHIA